MTAALLLSAGLLTIVMFVGMFVYAGCEDWRGGRHGGALVLWTIAVICMLLASALCTSFVDMLLARGTGCG